MERPSRAARLFVVFALALWLGCLREAQADLVEKLRNQNIEHYVVNLVKNTDGSTEFEAFDRKFVIELENDASLFHPDFEHHIINVNHAKEDPRHAETRDEDLSCLYRGFVRDEPSGSSKVHLSTCGGVVFGGVRTPDLDIVLVGDENDRILAYRRGDFVEEGIFGDVEADEVMEKLVLEDETGETRGDRMLFDVYSQEKTKYVKLLIVNDHEFYKVHGTRTHGVVAGMIQDVANLYNRMSELPNHVYDIRLQITGMISFSHGDPWNVVRASDGVEVDATALLNAFNEWRTNQLDDLRFPEHSVGQLLSGHNFAGSVVGLANMNAVCRMEAASAVNQMYNNELSTSTIIISHELGHNLGIQHADDNRFPETPVGDGCGQVKGAIMSSVLPSGSLMWSSCSVDYLNMFFEGYPKGCNGRSCEYPRYYGSRPCLEEESRRVWNLNSQCGNGILEDGEQCDCSLDKTDPCCDCSTCSFRSDINAECSSLDVCCTSECKFVEESERKLCRAAIHDECDMAEYCDGQSALCPKDSFLPTGENCSSNDGFPGACFAGHCQSHQDQCNRFSSHTFGDLCKEENLYVGDAGCEKLYCEDDEDRCILAQNGQDALSVEDGTPCGDGKVCGSGKCVHPSELELPIVITCFNGILDPGETDVDCGGICPYPCLPGEKCLNHTDCYGSNSEPPNCVNSSITSNDAQTETELPWYYNYTFEPPPGEKSCRDYLSQDSCEQFTGCMWFGNPLYLCKPRGLLPPNHVDEDESQNRCRNQKTWRSCVNWIKCTWMNDPDAEVQCFEIEEPKPPMQYGTCAGSYPYTGPRSDPGSKIKDWFSDVYDYFQNNPLIGAAIMFVITLTCLWCVFPLLRRMCCCRRQNRNRYANARSSRPEYGRKYHRRSRSSTRQSRNGNGADASGQEEVLFRTGDGTTSTSGPAPIFEGSPCPACCVHFSNPQNPNGLCNTCSGKIQSSTTNSPLPDYYDFTHSQTVSATETVPIITVTRSENQIHTTATPSVHGTPQNNNHRNPGETNLYQV